LLKILVALRHHQPIFFHLNFYLFSDVFTDLMLDNDLDADYRKIKFKNHDYACHNGMNKAAQIIFDEITKDSENCILDKAVKKAQVIFFN
jgi:predicted AAA+ superfamily ATPase